MFLTVLEKKKFLRFGSTKGRRVLVPKNFYEKTPETLLEPLQSCLFKKNFFFVTRPQGQVFRKNQVPLEHLKCQPKRVYFNPNSISTSRTRSR